MTTTHYAVLGVDQDATAAEIERAYESLHSHGVPSSLASVPGLDIEDVLLRLEEAHRVLADPRTRAAYDAALAQDVAATAATRAVLAESDARATELPRADVRITRAVRVLGGLWAVAGLGAAISLGAGAGVPGVLLALGALWIATVCCLLGALLRVSERRVLGLASYVVCVAGCLAVVIRLVGAPTGGLALAVLWLGIYVLGSELVARQQRIAAA